jgi:hypothetical protein
MYILHGKPDQHVTRISRSVRVWSQIICISRGQRVATFNVVSIEMSRVTAPRKRAPDTIHSTPTDRSMGSYSVSQLSFSPKTVIEAVGAKSIFYWWPTTGLTRPISLACDRYVQYLLTGANPSVLNRHKRGIQPPKGSTRSQIIQSQHSLKWNGVKHLSPTRCLSTTRHLSKSISTPSNW